VKKAASFLGSVLGKNGRTPTERKFEKFLIDTLYFPDATPPEEPPAEGRAKPGDKSVVFVPLKSGA